MEGSGVAGGVRAGDGRAAGFPDFAEGFSRGRV
jgi:hypothetical protein